MEALAHRKGEVVDMGAVPGDVGRIRMSLTCPSRLVNFFFILCDPDLIVRLLYKRLSLSQYIIS